MADTPPPTSLDEVRARIDAVDKALFSLIDERAGLAQAVAEDGAVEVALWASRAPRGGPDPLAAFGRPLRTSRLPSPLLTRAWDHGLSRAPAGFHAQAAPQQLDPLRHAHQAEAAAPRRPPPGGPLSGRPQPPAPVAPGEGEDGISQHGISQQSEKIPGRSV